MKKEQAKKFNVRTLISITGRVAFLLAIMFLVAYLISVISESKTFFDDSSKRTALVQFDEKLQEAEDLADEHYENLYEIAEKVKYSQSKDEVVGITSSYVGSELFGDLRYYAQGKSYDIEGNEVLSETSGFDLIEALAKSNKQGCTDVYRDKVTGVDCIALFVPVRGSLYADGVLSILPARNLIALEGVLGKNSLAAILTDGKGTVYASCVSDSLGESVGNTLASFLTKICLDKSELSSVEDAMQENGKTACVVEGIDGEYVLTLSPVHTLDGRFFLIAMTEQEGLIAPEMSYVRYIINLTVIAIASLTIGMIYALFYYRDSKHALVEASSTDPAAGCANAESFRMQAGKLIQNRQQSYAVTIFEIRQFNYLAGKLSEDEVSDTLKFVAKVMSTFCHPRETFGYLGNGKFALLILYSGEKSIRDRVRLIETVVNKNAVLGARKSKKPFNIGASLVFDAKRYTMQELLNHASVACESAKTNVNLPFVVYNEQVNAEREHDARIEMEMETALANSEFRLFLQPKYNVHTDKVDSAEALVRWFDPKKGDYRFPGEFISLFESNGFITKLDHFMYIEVLKCLQAAAERGEKLVPVSVNVSLVTASSSDFLSFYVDNKKKYGIADNFITVEFTESFLLEDYQKLTETVEKLHRNGIRCSLDDFGSGYASFSVLKNVPFDELKLDRMLLDVGFNQEHDDAVLQTVVRLAKSLGMQVVQEGVETKEMFEKVVALGCDVIQGYYYAKAIPLEEYKLFIASNTSIKYKSLVK